MLDQGSKGTSLSIKNDHHGRTGVRAVMSSENWRCEADENNYRQALEAQTFTTPGTSGQCLHDHYTPAFTHDLILLQLGMSSLLMKSWTLAQPSTFCSQDFKS